MNQILLKRGRQDSEKALAFIRSLPLDKGWMIEIKAWRPTRSEAQNRYLWGVCYPSILQHGGEDLGGWEAKDLHDFFLGEHFGWETTRAFGKVRQRAIRRSAKLNKQEFSDFIAFIQRRAAELGVVIPDPDEYLAEAAGAKQ